MRPDNPINPESNAVGPAPTVWPPPPTCAFGVPAAPPVLDVWRVQNFWLVLILTYLTSGVYTVIWLRQQVQRMNPVYPQLRLSLGYVNIVLAVVIAYFSLAWGVWLYHYVAPAPTALVLASDIVWWVTAVAQIVLTFQVRNRFNLMLTPDMGDTPWFSAVFTFLFGVIYLQYKVNRNIRRLIS